MCDAMIAPHTARPKSNRDRSLEGTKENNINIRAQHWQLYRCNANR